MTIFQKVTFHIFDLTSFKFYSHLPHFFISLDGSQFNENVGREPFAPITNNNNRIHNNTLDMTTESYMNINRIRNNILNGSNAASESYSRSHLNTTPRPNNPNHTFTPTPRPNNPNNTLTPSYTSSQ